MHVYTGAMKTLNLMAVITIMMVSTSVEASLHFPKSTMRMLLIMPLTLCYSERQRMYLQAACPTQIQVVLNSVTGTLCSISTTYGVSVARIQQANGLGTSTTLQNLQSLFIPCPPQQLCQPSFPVSTKSGDGLAQTANSFGISDLTAVEQLNPQFEANFNSIPCGTDVLLPGSSNDPPCGACSVMLLCWHLQYLAGIFMPLMTSSLKWGHLLQVLCCTSTLGLVMSPALTLPSNRVQLMLSLCQLHRANSHITSSSLA